MLAEDAAWRGGEQSFKEGSTQLGLYFASRVAQLHTDKKKQGRMLLTNGKSLGGGSFQLWLP